MKNHSFHFLYSEFFKKIKIYIFLLNLELGMGDKQSCYRIKSDREYSIGTRLTFEFFSLHFNCFIHAKYITVVCRLAFAVLRIPQT